MKEAILGSLTMVNRSVVLWT